MVAVFLSPFMVSLAKFAAAVEGSSKIGWAGVRFTPSSYISSVGFVSSLVFGPIAPVIGAAVDHSSQRRFLFILFSVIASVSAYLSILLLIPGMWWIGGIVYVLISTSYILCSLMIHAYLPEIAHDEKQRTKISAVTVILGNVSQLGFLILVILLSFFIFPAQFRSFRGEAGDSWFINGNQSIRCIDVLEYKCAKVPSSLAVEGRYVLEITGNSLSISQKIRANSAYVIDGLVMGSLQIWANNESTAILSLRIGADAILEESVALEPAKWTDISVLGRPVMKDQDPVQMRITVFGNANRYLLDNITLEAQSGLVAPLAVSLAGIFFHFGTLIVATNFKPRQASKPVPEGKNAFTAGLQRIFQSIKEASKKRDLLLFLFCVGFQSPASQTAASLFSVFLSEVPDFSVTQIGIVFVEAMFVGALSAFLTYKIASRVGFIRAFSGAVFFYGIGLIFVPIIINSPDRANLVWFASAFIVTFDVANLVLIRACLASMTPKGHEAEYFGVLSFFQSSFTWVGLLLAAVVNEMTGNIANSISALGTLPLISFLLSIFISKQALENVRLKELPAETPNPDTVQQ